MYSRYSVSSSWSDPSRIMVPRSRAQSALPPSTIQSGGGFRMHHQVRHYPLPPPSFPDAMVAVSRRIRNRAATPDPQYADLQVGKRPRIIPAALGKWTPNRDTLKINMGFHSDKRRHHFERPRYV